MSGLLRPGVICETGRPPPGAATLREEPLQDPGSQIPV